jgi:hypothetical protein
MNPWSIQHRPVTKQGRYSVILPAPDAAPTTPQGTGFATVFVGAAGTVAIVGRTGDNRNFSSSTLLEPSGVRIPLYSGLYARKGSLTGYLEVEGSYPKVGVSGSLLWSKPKEKGVTYFPAELKLTVTPRGGSFVAPAAGSAILPVESFATFNSSFTASAGNIVNPRIERALLKARPLVGRYEVNFDNAKRMAASLRIDPRFGTFSGSFYDTATKKVRRTFGVFVQSENAAFGVWNTATRSGSVKLQPDSTPR